MNDPHAPCPATPERFAVNVAEPSVDILRNAGGLTLLADMPGVDETSLSVDLKSDVLTISGKSTVQECPSYSEFGPVEYRRSFKLGEQIDRDRIRAVMKNGVLRVEMSMHEQNQPRKIEVQMDDSP
ncbi:MAG: Hsp20/alpha crystallin family protein [Kiritimatiellia bacterium]